MKKCITFILFAILNWMPSLSQNMSEKYVMSIGALTQKAQQHYANKEYDACCLIVDSIETVFTAFQKEDPTNADSLFLLSAYIFGVESETERGNYQSAIRRNEQLCLLASARIAALFQMGYTAEHYLGFWNNLWELFRETNRYQEALWVAQSMVQTAQSLLPALLNTQLNKLGLSYAKMNDHVMAGRCYQMAYDSFIQDSLWVSSPDDFYVIISNLSMTYYKNNQFEKGVNILTSNEAKQVIGELKDRDAHAYYDIRKLELRGLNDLARLYEAGPVALELYEYSAKNFGTNSLEYISALNAFGQYYSHAIELNMATDVMKEEASLLFKDVAQFWQEHPKESWKRDHYVSLNNIACYHSAIGDKPKAIEAYQELISLHQKDNTVPIDDRIHPLINYAIACYDVDDFEESRKTLMYALNLCQEQDYMRSEACAKICRTLAEISLLDYDYAKADEYATLGYNISCLLGNDNIETIYCLKELAIVSARIGNYDLSFEYQSKALKIKNRLKIPLTPTDWLVLAEACCIDSLVLQATGYASEIMESSSDFTKKAHLLTLRGRAYGELGDYTNAERCLIESLSIREHENDNMQIAISNNDLSILYTKWRKFDKAEYHAQKAFQLLPNETLTIGNLAALYYAKGDQSKFEELLPLLMAQIKKDTQKAFRFMDAQQRQAFMESDMNILHFAEELPRRFPESKSCIQAGYDAVLLEKALLLGANSNFQYLASHSQEERIQNEYRNWIQLSSLLQTEKDSIEHDKLASRVSVSEKILQSYIWQTDSLRMSYSWNDVCKSLPKNTAAVEFIEYDASQDILGITHDSTIYAALVLYPGASSPRLVPLCTSSELKQCINKGASAYLSRNASTLYEKIWMPILSTCAGIEHFYFSPTGLLHQISLEAVSMPDGNLISDMYPMHRISSTKQLLFDDKRPSYQEAALFGGLNYSYRDNASSTLGYHRTRSIVLDEYEKSDSLLRAGIMYLEGTKAEVNAIEQILRKGKIRSQLYKDSAGTEDSFKALSGKRIDILHVATHGFCFEGKNAQIPAGYRNSIWQSSSTLKTNPMSRCGLLMAGAHPAWTGDSIPAGKEDGILLAQEVALMDLSSVDIVVLSACQTGKGEITEEGVYGLQRAFKNAGANTIIMSLWNVDDESTVLMMTSFYQNLIKGHSKAESFSMARKEVRSRMSSPKHWAGFIMLD